MAGTGTCILSNNTGAKFPVCERVCGPNAMLPPTVCRPPDGFNEIFAGISDVSTCGCVVHSAKHTHTHTKRTPPLRGNRHPREWKMRFCPLCARSKTCRALAGRLLADFAGSGKAHGEHKVAFICAHAREACANTDLCLTTLARTHTHAHRKTLRRTPSNYIRKLTNMLLGTKPKYVSIKLII